MNRNIPINEPPSINEVVNDFEYHTFIDKTSPLNSKSSKIPLVPFSKEIWVIILEYIDYIWNEFTLDDIDRYLMPILNSPLEALIYKSSNQFSELEAAYYYDGLNLSKKIQLSLQFLYIYGQFFRGTL